ncbi:MAG: PhnD/SsuA/transferrin family substrate-binding protein, partial [Deltaproteobacteria bacterium]|nr:PhnD/SsuA/transferrin family substrate-binding protein [Deltaproteobacteria bacterium]
VAAMVSPAVTWESYEGILRYISDSLGKPYRLIQRRTYREINDLLLAGEIDLAFVCSGTYAALPEDAPVELIAVPVVNDRAVYHSVIIVRDKTPYKTFSDLRGARFAFSDELSNTGHIYPRWLLAEAGEEPASFFSGTIFTGSHDRSILAVYRHLADGTAVHELVYRAIVVPGSPYWGKLRIIDTSPDFATPPVVAPVAVPADVRARMRNVLLGMGASEEGRARLKPLGFDGFAPAEPADYFPIREMLKTVEKK